MVKGSAQTPSVPARRCSAYVLVVILAQAHQQAVVIRIEELVARAFGPVINPGGAANVAEESGLVESVEVHLVIDAVGRVAGFEFVDDIRLAGGGTKGRYPVVMAHDLIADRAGLDHAGPTDQAGHAEGAFPIGVLLRTEPGHGAVGPGVHVGTVIAGIDNDGIVRDAHVVEGLEEITDDIVVFHHAIDVLAVAVDITAAMVFTNVGA